MTLKELNIGQTGIVKTLGGDGALRQHFLDMGIIPGTEVTIVKYAPMGDPVELRLHGYELTLRIADAQKIEIVPLDEKIQDKHKNKKISNSFSISDCTNDAGAKKLRSEHPGLGEGGRFHPKGSGSPLPD